MLRAYQRCRASNNSALVIVLGSMAWTNEFVLSSIKWHHTSKMCADSIYSKCGKSFVALHNQVCWISLMQQHQIVRSNLICHLAYCFSVYIRHQYHAKYKISNFSYITLNPIFHEIITHINFSPLSLNNEPIDNISKTITLQ